MGALAGMLKLKGHRVTGSDRAFYPPIGPMLKACGVETMQGFSPDNLAERPDLVVVGNVCRPDHVEARAAIDSGLRYTSFPAAIEEMFLPGHDSLVVAGTHGKTTTSTLLAHLLHDVGLDPSFLVGGVPGNFEQSYRLGRADGPFVIEGDEYDVAFFEKKPKFWRYRPHAAIITSIEHDHIDIYPDLASYLDAFRGFVAKIPREGLLVAWAGDPHVRTIAKEAACRVSFYGLESDDCGDVMPKWMGMLAPAQAGVQPIDVFGSGMSCGRVLSPMAGAHNARNALAAIALATEGAGAPLGDVITAMTRFRGVRRRQELLGIVRGVRVYEDFAHHPTAVRETLRAIRSRHREGKLIAAFEPRSATACRKLHQDEYASAFASADLAVLAPLGRDLPREESLSTQEIAAAITRSGGAAIATSEIAEVISSVTSAAEAGDTIVLMSNGSFSGVYDDVLAELAW